MIPKNLWVIHTVVMAGSIRKASYQLGVAPSSVSRRIGILEHEFGTKLFERSTRGLVLTHAGQLVADYARGVVIDGESLRRDLNDLGGIRRRLIHIVSVESFAVGRSMDALARFQRNYEGVTFRFTVLPAPKVTEAVSRGECDVGLAFCSGPHPKIKVLDRIREPVIVATPIDHPLTEMRAVPLSSLTRYRVALPETDFHVRDLFNRSCYAENLQIEPALTANTFETLRDFVRTGEGIAVLPSSAVDREVRLGEMAAIPIDVPALQQTTIDIIVGQQRLPRVDRLFTEELCKTLASKG